MSGGSSGDLKKRLLFRISCFCCVFTRQQLWHIFYHTLLAGKKPHIILLKRAWPDCVFKRPVIVLWSFELTRSWTHRKNRGGREQEREGVRAVGLLLHWRAVKGITPPSPYAHLPTCHTSHKVTHFLLSSEHPSVAQAHTVCSLLLRVGASFCVCVCVSVSFSKVCVVLQLNLLEWTQSSVHRSLLHTWISFIASVFTGYWFPDLTWFSRIIHYFN